MDRNWVRVAATAFLISATLGSVPTAWADCGDNYNLVLPPKSHKYGKSLNQWTEMYWRWFYESGGMTATEPYQPTKEKLVFMPLPAGEYVSGSFTAEDPGIVKGTIEVTIKRNTAFYLPAFVWISETYNTGQKDDPVIPDDHIRGVAIHPSGEGVPEITLDGDPILEQFWRYYVGPEELDPIIEYSEPTSYGSIGVIAYQGVGFVMKPLPKGTYTLHLYERLYVTTEDLPGFEFEYDFGVIYDNTWIIHVK